ncbi:MAG: PmoA family protein [Roseibacillus sp.]|nr:PmoA family protein [Roseibacillus sp.]
MTTRLAAFPFLLSFLSGLLPAAGQLQVTETDKTITITRGEVTVLKYHKAEVPPPEQADPIYKRSGFIHPLCAPNGEPVTGIHPADHFHHLGLWHAWVKTKHGKDTPDFWNLRGRTGRVRYAKTIGLHKGSGEDRSGGFAVEQEQVAYKGPERKETVVLREKFEVRAEFVNGENVVSYLVEQTNVSRESLILPAYRYGGGLAYRAPHHWDKTNSDYLTSEGLDRTNSHATRARWVAMWGATSKGPVTLTVMMHPGNRDFPQRLRTWPPSSHNGAIFFNVVPAQEKPWEIKPGERIVESYLLTVSDGKPAKERIEKGWKAWAKK